MKKILLYVLIFSSLSQLSAQDYSVEWGEEFDKNSGLLGWKYFVGADDDNFYMTIKPKKKNIFAKFDFDNNLVSQEELGFEYDGDDLVPSSFVTTNQGIYAYFSNFKKKAANTEYFKSKFEDGVFGTLNKIDVISEDPDYKYSRILINKGANNDTKFLTSESKEHVAHVRAFSVEKKKQADQIEVKMFDEYMDFTWTQTYNLDFGDNDISVKDAVTSNDGSIIILILVKKEKEDIEKGHSKYDPVVIHLFEDGSQKEYKIEFEEGYSSNEANLFVSNDADKAILGGFYSADENKKHRFDGIYSTNIDLESGDIDTKRNEFTDEFLENMIKDKAIEKDKGLSSSYDIDWMVSFEDGGYAFIAENYYITYHQVYNAATKSWKTITYYNTDDVIFSRFDADGNLVNVEKIDKRFKSTSPYLVSYSYAFHNEKVYLLYSDFKNREEKKDKGVKRAQFCDLTVFNEDGEIDYQETLFHSKEIDKVFYPYLFLHKDEKMIIYAQKKKTFQFGTITID